jgi:RecA-family ATPase
VLQAYPSVLYGDGGVAKSLLALAVAVAVASTRREFLGRGVGNGPVLYLDFELDADEQHRRVRRVAEGMGLEEPPADIYYMSALGFSPSEAFDAALEACERLGIGLVVLDSVGPAMEGDAEHARDVIRFHNRVLEPFRAAGATVFAIDHQSKPQAAQNYREKRAFGSVYKGNLSRSVIQAEATERGKDTLTIRLRHKKHNFGPLAEPFEAKLTFSEDAVTFEPVRLDASDLAEEETLNAIDKVRLALEEGPAYPAELAKTTGLAEKTVKNKLTELRRTGEVQPTGERDENAAEQV